MRDANAFVTSSYNAIERSAPHIYLSALPFAAKDSMVYKTFVDLCPGTISVKTFGIDRHGGSLVMTLTGHGDEVRSIAYSPDGLLLASGSSDGSVRIWDTRTGEETMSPMRSEDSSVRSVTFAPNGNSLATGSDAGVINLWNLEAGQVTLRTLGNHTRRVNCVAFSPDGSLLASASADTTVRLWRPDSGQQLSVLNGHANEVLSVAFSSDGEVLASASADLTIRLWRGDTNKTASQPLRGHEETIKCGSILVGWENPRFWFARRDHPPLGAPDRQENRNAEQIQTHRAYPFHSVRTGWAFSGIGLVKRHRTSLESARRLECCHPSFDNPWSTPRCQPYRVLS